MVAIFPNVCLWRRSLCSNLALTLKNCIEPPSYASTAYVVAIWPSFLFDSFVKIWDTCENFLGKWFKFPVRLCTEVSLPLVLWKTWTIIPVQLHRKALSMVLVLVCSNFHPQTSRVNVERLLRFLPP